MTHRRLPRHAGVPLALLLLATACGDRGGTAAGGDEGGEPERGGTAVTVEAQDINRPLPLIGETSLDANVEAVLYLTLTGKAWRDGELVFLNASEHPLALARRWELAGPDSSILRYHMRSDVQWSDGTPVTARDVRFTYTIITDPGLASANQDYAEQLDSVVVESDSTVAFHFQRRYPEMLFHSGLGILPAHVYESVPPGEIRNHPSVTDPVGKLVTNGPFVLSAWQRGAQVTLAPNPRFQPRPNLDQIVIRIIPEATTRLVELQTGNVDFVHQVGFDQIAGLEAQAPHVRFETEEKRSYEYIGYNPTAHPAFADPEIRRALGMAIDRDRAIDALEMTGYAVPAGGPYSPIFTNLYDAREQAPLPYDTAGAKRILDAKGWRDTDGDGVRDKAGRALRFTLTTNTGNQRRADIAQIVQQQWRAIGVDAQIRMLEFNTMIEQLLDKEFEATLSGWSVALSPDIGTTWRPESPYNFVSYDNPQVISLIDQALAQPTEEAAARYWKQAAALVVRDQPYTFLYFYDLVDGVNQRLRNTEVNTLGRYLNPWEWWIPAAQQRAGATPTAK